MSRPKRSSARSNKFRIIGGQWRGRKFSFAANEQTRPTGDRVKETLFNWLQQDIEGARCLDLYAGSGALGLEALSRGATEVVFVDKDPKLIDGISDHLARLECDRAELICGQAETVLERLSGSFDVVFLDPPFADQNLAKLCKLLDSRNILVSGSLCYLEQAADDPSVVLPQGWHARKEKQAGQVQFSLIELV